MSDVLICTIARNLENVFENYYTQLKKSVLATPQYNFLFSIYENDSRDNTKKIINEADWTFFPEWAVKTENIGTQALTGTNPTRVENLAKARNKCLEAKDFLSRVQWVLFIETDIEYSVSDFQRILEHNKQDVDIFSGMALVKDTRIPYDTWATRHSPESRGSEGFLGDGVKEFWATFSCVCLYKSEPFQKGLRFHWINERIGTPDCDTTVICEIFRKNGYSKIIVDQTINPFHYLENLVMYVIHPGPGDEKLYSYIRKAAREHDDVVISKSPVVPTREYVLELESDEIPHVYLIKCMDNSILKNKPESVMINLMCLELGDPAPRQITEAGVTNFPNFCKKIHHRDAKNAKDVAGLPAIGALSIWKVKLFT
jgi:hypothetical protein